MPKLMTQYEVIESLLEKFPDSKVGYITGMACRRVEFAGMSRKDVRDLILVRKLTGVNNGARELSGERKQRSQSCWTDNVRGKDAVISYLINNYQDRSVGSIATMASQHDDFDGVSRGDIIALISEKKKTLARCSENK